MRGVKKSVKQVEKDQEQEQPKVEYTAKVLRATQFDDSSAGFDLQVNGVTIYGMVYREYVNKNGEEGFLIDFPSRKGTGNFSNKYFKHCWFPISKDLKDDIYNQIVHLLNEV